MSDDQGARVLRADVDHQLLPLATGTLQVLGEEERGAILRVQGMSSLGAGQVYQAWVRRDGVAIPQPTFQVSGDGVGAVAVPVDLSEASMVLVTREPLAGALTLRRRPLLSVSF
jgi:hypothetical protein